MSPAPLTLYTLANGQRIPDLHADDLHADDVREAANVIVAYYGTLSLEDAVAHGIAAWRACVERRAIQERAADRRAGIARGIHGGLS